MRLPDHLIPGRAILLDRDLIRRVYDIRSEHGNDPRDEVWDGVLVLLPLVDNLHQELRGNFCYTMTWLPDGWSVRLGGNVSDRNEDWMTNFRCPDGFVIGPDSVAVNRNSHWQGGPDFVIEISSPGEEPREKLNFYAKIGSREVLIVDRDPWVIELYRCRDGRYESVGRSDVMNPTSLASGVLPISFRLIAGTERPRIELTHADGRTWRA